MRSQSPENVIQHLWGEPSSESVLLARVVTATNLNRTRLGQLKSGTMAEFWAGLGNIAPGMAERIECGCPCDAAERHHRLDARQDEFGFPAQPGSTRVSFVGSWLVVRWRAVHSGGDAHLVEMLTVVAICGFGPARKSGSVKCSVEPVAASVTGEHASRSVRAVRARCQADDPDSWLIATETRNRPAPILIIAIGGALIVRNLRAPVDQPRTLSTFNDAGVEFSDVPDGSYMVSEVGRQENECSVATPSGRARRGTPRVGRR